MASDAYFDLKIGRIPAGRAISIDPEGEADCGVYFDVPLTNEQLKEQAASYGSKDQVEAYVLSVTDNGPGGDGTWLTLATDGGDEDVVSLYLNPGAVMQLYQALNAVIRMNEIAADNAQWRQRFE